MDEMIRDLEERVLQEQALAQVVHDLGGEMRVVLDRTTVSFPSHLPQEEKERVTGEVQDTAAGLSKVTLVIEFVDKD